MVGKNMFQGWCHGFAHKTNISPGRTKTGHVKIRSVLKALYFVCYHVKHGHTLNYVNSVVARHVC